MLVVQSEELSACNDGVLWSSLPAFLARAEASEDHASARFAFTAQLGERLRDRSYCLIHEAGIEIFRLKHLEGTVIYDSPEDPAPVARVEVAVCGVGRVPIKCAGFVVLGESSAPRTWAVSKVAVGIDGAARVDGRSVMIPESPSGISLVRMAFAFTDPADGTKYLFVRRVPDTHCQYACCESSDDLFAVGAKLTLVLSNGYDCDL
jgi:hypothetical protein